jgi:hypothetical protein
MSSRSQEARNRARLVRNFRRRWLTELGWTIVTDTVVYGPDDPERTTMHSLATAARAAGLPNELEKLASFRAANIISDVVQRSGDRESAQRHVGEPWRRPLPVASSDERRTMEVDVGTAERGLRGHVDCEAALVRPRVGP